MSISTELHGLRHDLVSLAEVVSPAVRIEPALLRRARLELLPRVGVETEADLWFSRLVGAQSPRGLVLRPESAEVLRQRLTSDPWRLRRACALVREVHAGAEPTIRLEEELIAHALLLAPGEEPRFDMLIEAALSAMRDDTRREGLARWALRALPGLPAAVQKTGAARAMKAVAASELGRSIGDAQPLPSGRAAAWLRLLLPNEQPRVGVGLRMLADGIEVSVPPLPDAHAMLVRETNPLLLEISLPGAHGRWLPSERPGRTVLPLTPVSMWSVEHANPLSRVLAVGSVTAVACDDFGTRVAVGRMDGTIELWDVLGDAPPELLRFPATMTGLAFMREPTRLLGVGDDNRLLVLDLAEDGRMLLQSRPARGPLAVEPTGRRVAYANEVGGVTVEDLLGEPYTLMWGRELAALAFAGGRIVAGTAEGEVATWNLGGPALPSVRSVRGPVIAVAVGPNESVGVLSAAGELEVWDDAGARTLNARRDACAIGFIDGNLVVAGPHGPSFADVKVDAAAFCGPAAFAPSGAFVVSTAAVDAVEIRSLDGPGYLLEHRFESPASGRPSERLQPIGVFGIGYLGLVTAAGFAHLGRDVYCVDIDPEKIERLEAGEIPIYEPGLAEIVAENRERLHFSTNSAEALKHARLLFVTVGTPPMYSGEADLSAVRAIVDGIPSSDRHALVMTSTVPAGTGSSIKRLLAAEGKHGVSYVACPGFLQAGSAIKDFLRPDRVVVGDDGDWAGDAVVELYEPLDAPLVRTDITSAEMVKLASNAFVATKISFINEIANVCEETGADINEVARGIGLDDRIREGHLRAGIGYGGSQLPSSVNQLKQLSGSSGYHFQLLSAVIEVNELQKRRMISKLQKHLGSLVGKTITLLGLAFKPNTDDMREASSLVLSARLQAFGATVRVYDPVAEEQARHLIRGVHFATDAMDAIDGADAIVLVTEWDEFIVLDWAQVAERMAGKLVLDGRNALDREAVAAAGLNYEGIGRTARTILR